MEPSKVGDSIRTMRKTHSAMISPQDPKMEAKNPMQLKGAMDVDSIPSLVIKPMIPTLVEDKEPTPMTEHMHIDP
jgi:hypothetical protein